jgi:hypothetical protein
MKFRSIFRYRSDDGEPWTSKRAGTDDFSTLTTTANQHSVTFSVLQDTKETHITNISEFGTRATMNIRCANLLNLDTTLCFNDSFTLMSKLLYRRTLLRECSILYPSPGRSCGTVKRGLSCRDGWSSAAYQGISFFFCNNVLQIRFRRIRSIGDIRQIDSVSSQ